MGVASYILLESKSFTLAQGSPKKAFSFTIPENIVAGDSGRRPLLAMNFRSDGGVQARVTLDGQVLSEANIPDGVDTRDEDPLGPESLQPGEHTLSFERLGGDGTLTLSDITVWYQVTV